MRKKKQATVDHLFEIITKGDRAIQTEDLGSIVILAAAGILKGRAVEDVEILGMKGTKAELAAVNKIVKLKIQETAFLLSELPPAIADGIVETAKKDLEARGVQMLPGFSGEAIH